MSREKLSDNRQAWDHRVPHHLKSDFYAQERFLAGVCSLKPPELELLPQVDGQSLLHLQCHFGQDSLSWARRGAKVKGIDFSPVAINEAKSIAKKLAIPAEFEVANVLELELEEEFDIVFSSYGVLGWLESLETWASVVARHLKPGGVLVLVEFHPVLSMFDFEKGDLAYEYFSKAYSETIQGSYASEATGESFTEHFWTYSLHEVMQALIRQGLQLRDFREYDHSPWGCFSGMIEEAPGRWVWPKAVRLPHLFSLKMSKSNSEIQSS